MSNEEKKIIDETAEVTEEIKNNETEPRQAEEKPAEKSANDSQNSAKSANNSQNNAKSSTDSAKSAKKLVGSGNIFTSRAKIRREGRGKILAI